jgi:putative sugar O-methyltransferase
MYRRFILSETRYRIDYWRSQTEGRFSISALQGPAVGNPFGAMMEGTLVPVRAEYQHYCAQRILDLITSHNAIVAEIGGGFGGMAYYLLRDCPKITYIDFDVPESLALTAYYLSKSMPQFRLLLYGEEELTQSAITGYDIILMPPWELSKLPVRSVDITFSSHALSDLISVA